MKKLLLLSLALISVNTMFGWSVTIINTVQPTKKQINIGLQLGPNNGNGGTRYATHVFTKPNETITLSTTKIKTNQKGSLYLPWAGQSGTFNKVNNVENGSSWKIITVDDTTNGGYPALNGSWKLVPAK